MHFNRRFEHETGCCKIHAASAYRGAKSKCVDVCHDLQEGLKNDPQFLPKAETGYESWYYDYDPGTKQQSSQWKSPNLLRPKKALQVHSSVKVDFFYVEGIMHREFVPTGKRVNQQFYLNVLIQLCQSLRRKCPEKWQSGDSFLHHDNAPAHTALIARPGSL
jgi:hypothetical protein